jgi:hypothetical protein
LCLQVITVKFADNGKSGPGHGRTNTGLVILPGGGGCRKRKSLNPDHLHFLKEMINTSQMFLTFISEIKPVLNNKPQITLSNAEHHQEPVVKMAFAYNREIIDKIKNSTDTKPA